MESKWVLINIYNEKFNSLNFLLSYSDSITHINPDMYLPSDDFILISKYHYKMLIIKVRFIKKLMFNMKWTTTFYKIIFFLFNTTLNFFNVHF